MKKEQFDALIEEANSVLGKLKKKFMVSGTLADGTPFMADPDISIGSAVFISTDEGEIPAPDGEHQLSEGGSIVTEGGVITAVNPEGEEEVQAGEKEEEMREPKVVTERQETEKRFEETPTPEPNEVPAETVTKEEFDAAIAEKETEATEAAKKFAKELEELKAELNTTKDDLKQAIETIEKFAKEPKSEPATEKKPFRVRARESRKLYGAEKYKNNKNQ